MKYFSFLFNQRFKDLLDLSAVQIGGTIHNSNVLHRQQVESTGQSQKDRPEAHHRPGVAE